MEVFGSLLQDFVTTNANSADALNRMAYAQEDTNAATWSKMDYETRGMKRPSPEDIAWYENLTGVVSRGSVVPAGGRTTLAHELQGLKSTTKCISIIIRDASTLSSDYRQTVIVA